MEVAELVRRLVEDQAFLNILNNPLTQFGTDAQPFLGATFMPERLVNENAYVEEGINYVSLMANDGTRYSPVQIKEGVMTGTFQVILGNSDIGSNFTGQQYDALVQLLRTYQPGAGTPSMDEMPGLTNWAERTLNMPLRMKNELYRWQAVVNAQILRSGDGGYREVVNIPNPAGHRIAAGGDWTDPAYDPWPDIIDMAQFLRGKGFTLNRLIGPSSVLGVLTNNEQIRRRGGMVSIMSGSVVGMQGQLSAERLNELFRQDGIPALEIYDAQYRVQTQAGFASAYYLARNVLVFLCTTGREETVISGDLENPLTLENTLGYVGVGRTTGQAGPGRAVHVEALRNKPPRISGEAWQTSGPIIYEPEAIGVITGIGD